ncbi:putative glycosyltransferase [Methanocella paludicola SANAE]|uniref:Glycosyltransferase n=1 Tax=Methanocella paludicola (strain DSM 17711 / JCM 13418 / NBRC 101707 / SANAE) TaxID=304371 RepID=D1YV10_METPS|nr:glycosyltransferase [Methanocella paludicola]BAI60282.1 putative glycosyltransferase [Methanocella paludicola SANAE]
MDFSIIVPAFNEEKRIRACLESIKAQHTAHSYELIVSDSGSTDGTVSIAREYTDKVVVCKEKGTARARNEGAKLAGGDILVFIDSDTIVSPDYIDTVARAFKDPRLLAASCAFKFTRRSPKLLGAEYVTNAYYVLRSAFHAATLPGFNVCIRREAFEKLGGFRLCHLEDLDMSIKLRKMGRTKYLPRRVVVTSSRRLEQDGVLGTLKYYGDLFEASQGRRLGFEPVKLGESKFDDYVHRE